MKNIFGQLGFAGTSAVLFMIGVGLACLGVKDWGIPFMLLGGGFLLLIGANETSQNGANIFTWILGLAGLGCLIACGILFSIALKPKIQQTTLQIALMLI